MKKVLLTVAFLCAGLTAVSAQEFIAAKAGFTNASQKISTGFGNASNSEAGFHIGVLTSFEITEAIDLQPEILFTSAGEASFLQIPVLGTYELGDSGFSLHAGPQINFILEETPEDFSAFSLGLTFGVGYDINENFFVEAHYALQLTDSYTGDGSGEIEGFDFSSRTSFLNLGVGYKFM